MTLSNSQKRVLVFLAERGAPATAAEIRTGVGLKNVGQHLRVLADQQFVKRIAPSPTSKRNVFWQYLTGAEMLPVKAPEAPAPPPKEILWSMDVVRDDRGIHVELAPSDAARLLDALGGRR